MKNRVVSRASLRRFGVLAALCLAACATPSEGGPGPERVGSFSQGLTNTLLHSFGAPAGDGQYPSNGEPALSGSTLYGMTRLGGASGNGAVFKVNTDGSGYALLRSFAGGAADGSGPYGSLVVSGSTLYGMTAGGGAANRGTVFKVNTDGSGYALVHSFTGGAADGSTPYGSLVVSGSTLYGMTQQGGASDRGTVFKVNTDGSGYALMRSFAGGTDGTYPGASLVVSGTTLYGMTEQGGTSGVGTVFKINTDGSDYARLWSFAGGAADGTGPRGSLVVSGSILYGMTRQGGSTLFGTVFKINTDGSGHALLRTFAGGVADGAYPTGALVVLGSTLYGMTPDGGALNVGTVFKVNTDGSGYAVVRSFLGGAADGAVVRGSLVPSNFSFYGMTTAGGVSNAGTVFKLDLFCSANQRVAANLCVTCAAGSTRAGGDDPAGADTTCDATVCAENQRVFNNACVACAPGSTRAAGDLATNADTSCDPIACAVNEYVSSHACLACAAGGTRAAGDLATGPNTACANTVCGVNEYVAVHECTPCALGSTRPAGDLATGADTTCAATVCAANQHVASHACVACAPGGTRAAGDLATGPNTACASVVCAVNEYVANHACTPCPPGSTRPAGDLATGADTTCTAADAGTSPDAATPSPDPDAASGTDAGEAGEATVQGGGCSSSPGNPSSQGGVALAVLALAGLRRRRAAPRGL